MLKVIPKQWFSWNFSVIQGTQSIADISISPWWEKGQLTIQGMTYSVYRESPLRNTFILETAGSVVARATKTSIFQRSFLIEHAGRQYTLQATSPFRRTFLLLDGSREIGSIAPEGIFTRRTRVDLPDEVPLPVKALIIWLTLVLWKRDSEAA